jgi:hypothetical protein
VKEEREVVVKKAGRGNETPEKGKAGSGGGGEAF